MSTSSSVTEGSSTRSRLPPPARRSQSRLPRRSRRRRRLRRSPSSSSSRWLTCWPTGRRSPPRPSTSSRRSTANCRRGGPAGRVARRGAGLAPIVAAGIGTVVGADLGTDVAAVVRADLRAHVGSLAVVALHVTSSDRGDDDASDWTYSDGMRLWPAVTSGSAAGLLPSVRRLRALGHANRRRAGSFACGRFRLCRGCRRVAGVRRGPSRRVRQHGDVGADPRRRRWGSRAVGRLRSVQYLSLRVLPWTGADQESRRVGRSEGKNPGCGCARGAVGCPSPRYGPTVRGAVRGIQCPRRDEPASGEWLPARKASVRSRE